MQNVARGVGLSGLTTLIFVCAMATQPAAGETVKIPTVQAPRITLTNAKTAPPGSNKTISLTNGTIVKYKGTQGTPTHGRAWSGSTDGD
jgi:hypothetical protein